MKRTYIVPLCLSAALLVGCAAARVVHLSCQEREVEIYVNDEYAGRDLVRYTVPAGCKYIEVSCRREGVEIYGRRYYVKGLGNTLVELQIPKNYKYSDKPY